MSIIRIEKKDNYSVISNTFLNDTGLSWQAKGLLSYLLTKPDDWQIYLTDLSKRSLNGKDSTRNTIQELMKAGYIEREAVREKGKFQGYNYTVREISNKKRKIYKPKQPCRENRIGKTVSVKPKTDNPETENPTLVNTDINQILNKVNTEYIASDDADKKLTAKSVIDIFDKKYKTVCKTKFDYSKADAKQSKNIAEYCNKQEQPEKFLNALINNAFQDSFFISNASPKILYSMRNKYNPNKFKPPQNKDSPKKEHKYRKGLAVFRE